MVAFRGATFKTVDQCTSVGREGHTVVADMDGTLLLGRSSFPYFALVAFEVGGVLRLLLLLLAAPLVGVLYYFLSESAGIKVLIFAALAGARVEEVELAARAVLPKFYLADVHPEAWRVFSACGRRCVLTANPRIMVEAFLKEYLGADLVIGTELGTYKGRLTGFAVHPGVLVGRNKAAALRKQLPEASPEIGLGDRETDFPFMSLCQEAYVVPSKPRCGAVASDKLPKPVVFHDGRLVQKPTPLLALVTVLWFPAGFLLACLRIATGALLPMRYVYHAFRALGVRVTVRGTPPPPASTSLAHSGVLFVCSHRTLLDPVFLSVALGRPIAAVTYSVSRLSEILSPIRTVRLSRDRARDAAMIRKLLQEGDLAICPEGTTCREPFLLRFSALFAELTDQIVPVATCSRMSMFHGTTARGWKGMDPFYFFMNPSPAYEVTFLDKLPLEITCSGGKSSHEVANYIQRAIASTLSYECTRFTRKDKYRALAGNDGTVPEKKSKAEG
ncbi:glycerol-3-phosphate acyltransferase RAM2-like [Musa acuminata AAA Group]|uniref:glycerol-3-phosphate acyltransferase RAM2-like n=1 Tax=Musa acuminata AAA Group TaxID=214697 RepID=UPI0031E08F6F